MLQCHVGLALSDLEEEFCQTAECSNQSGEDEDKDNVGSKCHNQVHEAKNAHVHVEEGKCRRKDRVRRGSRRVRWVVGNRRVEVWCQSCAECKPEGTEGGEDDEGESVAQDKFEKSTQHHEKTTEEVVNTNFSRTQSACMSPAEQNVRERSQREQKTNNSQWSWVAKSRPDVVGDSILGREIDLLKQFRGDGNASGGPNSPQCRLLGMMVVVKVISAVDRITASVVLFDIGHVRHVDGIQGCLV